MRSILLFVCLFISIAAMATNYYVDPSSTASSQTGALATPWTTLAQVQNKMTSFQPGDFIYFKRGQTFSGTLRISKSGTATAPITFAGYGSDTTLKPIFIGTGDYMIHVFYVQYVVIDGIKITDPTMSVTDHTIPANLRLGFYIDGSSYITVKNCDISLLGGGVNIQGNNNTIDKNSIYNMRMINNTVGGDDDYGAIPLIISGSNNTITNNFIKDGWANSYDYTYDGGAIEVYGASNTNNVIMYNTAVNCDGFMEIGYSNGGITSNNTVAYNKIVNCGELVYISVSGNFATSVANLQFYNNAIVNTINQLRSPNTMIGMSASSSATNTIINLKNNVFWLTSGIDVAASGRFSGSQLVHEDNIYHLESGSILNYTGTSSELTTTAQIFTSTTGDPLTWNYMPTSNSPAIDFGQNLGLLRDFVGNPVPAIPNAGILESPAAPAALTISATAGTISCNGGTTTVTVSATGGTSPYTGTGTFNVGAGTYTYTVTDAAGTIRTSTVTITQPTLLVSTVTAGSITIYGNTTTVTASATGGTSPYTYKIDGGTFQTSGSFSGIAAGSHTVTVKDANGCTSVKTITITQPTQLTGTSTIGTINCYGASTTVTISASGGVSPYTGTGTFTVTAGTYTYTITDAAGAVKQLPVTVSQPAEISATINAPGVYYSTSTSTVTVSAAGGTPAYNYSLDNGTYQTGNSFAAVAVGNHSIKVKDAKGCIKTLNFSVALLAINPLVISATNGFITCYGGNTTVTIGATGGIPPYTGTGTFTVTAGTYTYTVTDASGLSATKTLTVVQPKQIIVSVATGTINVYGGSTTATVTATGGTGAYSYKLDAGAYQASNIFNAVTAGTHTVTVMDARSCTGTKTFTLTQPAQGVFKLTLVSKTNETCRNRKDGTITVAGSGGTLPYSFKIGTGAYGTATTFTNLSPGTYTVTGRDANNVTSSVTVTINASTTTCPTGKNIDTAPAKNSIEANKQIDGLVLSAYPNPTTSSFSLLANSNSDEIIHIIVYNVNNQKVFETTSSINKINQFGANFTAGIYFVKVLQGREIKVIKLIKSN